MLLFAPASLLFISPIFYFSIFFPSFFPSFFSSSSSSVFVSCFSCFLPFFFPFLIHFFLPFLFFHYSSLPLSTFENAGFNWAWHSFTPLGNQKRDGDIVLRHEISNTIMSREKKLWWEINSKICKAIHAGYRKYIRFCLTSHFILHDVSLLDASLHLY